MSSIIDALKKSDANRPRKNHGMKMNLNLNNSAPSKKRFIILLVVLLIVVMATASWYLKKPSFIWQTADISAPTVKVPVTKPTKTPTKLAKPKPGQVQNKAQQPRKEVKPIQDNEISAANTSAGVSQNDPALTSFIDPETGEQFEATNSNVTTPPVANNNNPADQPIESKVIAETQVIDEQLSETPMKNKQAINKPVVENKTNNTDSVPKLFELPFAIRKDLPKLNLSVHIYDPIIENRMAILNGLSIHVGDTFEELLMIKDITQEGVILTIQNRDFIILK